MVGLTFLDLGAENGASSAPPALQDFFSRGAAFFPWAAEFFSVYALRLELFTTLSAKGSHAPIPNQTTYYYMTILFKLAEPPKTYTLWFVGTA